VFDHSWCHGFMVCRASRRSGKGWFHFIFDPWPASFDHRRSVVSRLVGTIGTVRDAHFFLLWLLPKRIFYIERRSLIMGRQMQKKDFPLFWLVRPHYFSTVAFGRSVGNIPLGYTRNAKQI
jgi:hypothetical protein